MIFKAKLQEDGCKTKHYQNAMFRDKRKRNIMKPSSQLFLGEEVQVFGQLLNQVLT